jgi:hypothetical protein
VGIFRIDIRLVLVVLWHVARRQIAVANVRALLMFADSIGPILVAVVMVANSGGQSGLRVWLARCLPWPLAWRQGWGWLAFALLFPLAVMSAAAGLHLALGGSMPNSLAAAQPLMTMLNFFMVLLIGEPVATALFLLVRPRAA